MSLHKGPAHDRVRRAARYIRQKCIACRNGTRLIRGVDISGSRISLTGKGVAPPQNRYIEEVARSGGLGSALQKTATPRACLLA
jgi:hypothetical protein